VELAQLADLVRVGAVAVGPGHFEDRRQVLEPRIREEQPEVVADEALAEVRVAIPIGAELGRRVVDMEGPESIEADRLVDLVETGVESRRVGDVHSGDP
jgi:hypothetical protein